MVFFRRRKPEADALDSGRAPAEDADIVSIETLMVQEAESFVSIVGDLVGAGSLDYSEESLSAVDALLDRYHRRELVWDASLLIPTSAYVCEVIRRRFGGRYLTSSDANPIVIVLGEPEFQLGVMVVGKVAGRVRNGDEDNIPFFYDGIAPLMAQKKSATLI